MALWIIIMSTVLETDAYQQLKDECLSLQSKAYAREIDEHKETMLLVNKADLLPLMSACIYRRSKCYNNLDEPKSFFFGSFFGQGLYKKANPC
ncbi:unnamed protein product [Eruca vesicaria subsp. sativa]|uniref:Uncharacterized protein n=1 Tax=Eruca vesicaria subsp. sativa TaxID=29727 RepID=A0ABC8LX32_ERUVS|nr:unnamed protein product [Eruca vesicaria subsp. sativa]